MARKAPVSTGQVDVFGKIYGLESLVEPPKVVEEDGLKVVTIVISEDNNKVPGYTEMALTMARKLAPEVKSKGKPPWMNAAWQAKRRKERAAG